MHVALALALAAAAPISLVDEVSGFKTPLFVGNAGDGSKRMFVVQQDGIIEVVHDKKIVGTFLDARSLLGHVGGEQGLLGLAFHPRFAENGRVFIAYTDKHQNDAVAELATNADHTRADLSSLQVLWSIPDFAPNHNGGMLAFGPDGKLYVGTGDGGGAGDPHRTAQDADALLGKMLRVDVDTTPIKPRVLYTGLRNPWRYSFDKKTGDLWIGDVGQDTWEEIDVVARTALDQPHNFGWSIAEGTHCFRPREHCDMSGTVPPVFEYKHGVQGCSVTGGVVSRAGDALDGVYFFGDFCSGRLWSARTSASGVVDVALALEAHFAISSFGEDEDGNAWVVDYGAGSIKRIAPAPPATPAALPR
ncbi:MAG TPA: PQQ-dependent sugar dehydrogenase [Myxococcota bacterium]|jgi:glucose/arabinose dehydrogenase